MPIGYWGYPNGQIPTNAMAAVSSRGATYWLEPSAQTWWLNLATEYKRAWGVGLEITDAYRNLEEQTYYWNLYQSGKGFPAARPGTSNHGWGMAVDIYTPSFGGSTATAQHAWLRRWAPGYGWTWTTGEASGESWHWEFTNVPTVAAGTGTAEPIKTIHPKDRRKKMYGFIRNEKSGAIAIVYGDGPNSGKKRALTWGEWQSYEAQGWKFKNVDSNTFSAVPNV